MGQVPSSARQASTVAVAWEPCLLVDCFGVEDGSWDFVVPAWWQSNFSPKLGNGSCDNMSMLFTLGCFGLACSGSNLVRRPPR